MATNTIMVAKVGGRQLDDYLTAVLDNRLRFSPDESEVSSIATSVETMLSGILTEVERVDPTFTLKPGHLLKYGSMYEHTKLFYPDEFDFMVIYGTLYDFPARRKLKFLNMLEQFSLCMGKVVSKLIAEGTTMRCGSGSLQIVEFLGRHGPASTVCMLYSCPDTGTDTHIHMDVTPAFKLTCVHDHISNDLQTKAGDLHRLSIRKGTCFMIYNPDWERKCGPTFSDIEKEFMVMYLSEQHRKVYKLLKYLINREHYIGNKQSKVFSSYALKRCMYLHHSICYTRPACLSDCLINVLVDLNDQLCAVNYGYSSSESEDGGVFRTIIRSIFSGASVCDIRDCEIPGIIADLKRLIYQLTNYVDGDVAPMIVY